jgi:glucose-6-phosphate 1-dehydrogenase
MIDRLVLFGATGDLAGRFLLPALAALAAAGELPDGFAVLGTSRAPLDDAAFRRHAAARLAQHAADVPAAAREALLGALRYRAVDLADPAGVAGLVRAAASANMPVAAYLALPPGAFPAAITALGAAGLPRGSRIVVEKPFGEDLAGAVALNRLLARVAGDAGEQAVFRVDHVLGMATVQNLLGLRLANRLLESAWNGQQIEQIEILWEETLALEGRAGYYDTVGALKDVMQNHMLQILALLAMEAPISLDAEDLRDAKVAALRSVRPPGPGEMAARARRARYGAGRLAGNTEGPGRTVPAYADEQGVDPGRGTETFAEVVLEHGSPRWAGTRFVLRAGKALARRRKEAVVRFRKVAHPLLGAEAGDELRIGLDGPKDLRLRLTGSAPGPPLRPVRQALTGPPPPSGLPAYGRVLLDILRGGSTLSVRGDEAEAAWQVVTPVLDAWASGEVPLEKYPAGSAGPSGRAVSR